MSQRKSHAGSDTDAARPYATARTGNVVTWK